MVSLLFSPLKSQPSEKATRKEIREELPLSFIHFGMTPMMPADALKGGYVDCMSKNNRRKPYCYVGSTIII